jgi:hypothetical protein
MRRVLFARFIAAAFGVGMLGPSAAFPHETAKTTVTFDREISRILRNKCISCHAERTIGFPLTTYEQTRPWAHAIQEEVLARHMPPWRAAPGYGEFANDASLTTRETQLFIAWIEGNGPKNSAQRLIANIDQLETAARDHLRLDVDRWELGRPTLIRQLGGNRVQAGQPSHVRTTVLDAGLKRGRWVQGIEYKPGDRRVVRAAFFSLEATGQWLASWTPWHGITSLPHDTAYFLPAGSRIVTEIHYRGTDTAVEDRGQLGFHFAEEQPSRCPSDIVLQTDNGNGTSAEKLRVTSTLAADTRLLALRPDLSPNARSVEISARKPDGTIQMLLFVQDVLAEWPTPYILKAPVVLPKGTELSATVYFRSTDAVASALRVILSGDYQGSCQGVGR